MKTRGPGHGVARRRRPSAPPNGHRAAQGCAHFQTARETTHRLSSSRFLESAGSTCSDRRGAARCQQHESARWWHLQPASRLQSSSHATGGCHWSTHNRHRPRFAPRGSLGTRPSARRRRARRLRGDHRQSARSWFVVEYVTSTLHYIGTMLGPGPRAKGTDCVALGEELRGRECDE